MNRRPRKIRPLSMRISVMAVPSLRPQFFKIEPLPLDHRDAGLGQHRAQDGLGDACGSNRQSASALGPPFELFALLPFPGGVLGIMLFDPLVEIAGQSADDFLAARIGHAKSGRTQSAEVMRRFDENTLCLMRAVCMAAMTPAEVPP